MGSARIAHFVKIVLPHTANIASETTRETSEQEAMPESDANARARIV
jgi:hypothetical protein